MSKARDLANAGTALGAVTATELGYVDGVTSAIQTQIDSKIGSASAINPTIVDAKGDIITATAADTPARLAVGNNGDTLVADSAATTGLRYQANFAAGKNLVINGDFGIWQRGTSFTSTNGTGFFGADRFNIYSATTGRTFSRQNTGPNGSSYFIRIQRDSGNTNTSALSIFYTLETAQSKPLAGKTLTLSFYARAGANFSAASSTMFSPAVYGTGTDQNQVSGFTGSASINNQGNVLTTSWQRFTMTGTVNAAATQVGFQLVYTPVGTASAADYMDIADVQWEVGSVATAFQTATGTLQGELAACQRYFISYGGLRNFEQICVGSSQSTTIHYFWLSLPVEMRVNPTIGYSSLSHWNVGLVGTGSQVYTALNEYYSGVKTVCWSATTSALTNSGGNKAVQTEAANTTSARLTFSAEL
jgi:hypothetical protein